MRRTGDRNSAVRYRSDVGFEARCDDCVRRGKGTTYWPLTLEFWDPRRQAPSGGWRGRSLVRCRACWKDRDARNRRLRLRDERKRATENARNARYRAECRDAIRLQQRARRNGTVAA